MEPKDYDINHIIVRPLYFGLVVNILIPMAILAVCYYLEGKQAIYNSIGDTANSLFYVLGVLSVGQAGVALWMREKAFGQPMIRRKETFEHDLIAALTRKSRPIFLLIAAIALYGYAYFFLTGRFKEAVFFVFFSFLAFQVVRPRIGGIRKLIDRQEKMVEKGAFLTE